MRNGPVVVAALLTLALSAGPLGAQTEEPLVPDGPWIQIETAGFVLIGNAPEDRLRGLATDAERLRHAIGRVLPGVRLDTPVPTLVFAFRDPEAFDDFRPGAAGGSAGFFVARDHASYFVINAHPKVNATRILYNEYIHHLLRINKSRAPAWLRFGLAELFSTFQVVDGVGYVGAARDYGLKIRPSELVPIADLVALADPVDTGVRSFELQSETLLRYLLDGPEDPRETREGFRRFVQKIYAGVPPGQAFEEALGEHFVTDGRVQLVAFLARSSRPVPVFAVDELPAVEMRSHTMARPEVLFRLGDLVLHSEPLRAADPGAYFRAALALEPEHGPSHAALGVLAQQGGDPAAALAHFEHAVRTEPEDFYVQFLYGSSLLESLGGRRPEDEESTARLGVARYALERATDLNPESAPVWVELSRAYGLEPKPLPKELAVLEKAMERFPDRADLVSNALLAYGRRGDSETAQALYRRLEAMGAEEPTLTRGREVLLRLAFFEADRLIGQERHEDAIGLFARIQSTTTDDRLRQQVSERIALLERAEEYNRFIGLVLECEERMANGDLAGAATLLEELRQRAHPGKQTEVVEALAEHLAGLQNDPGRAETRDR